MGKRKFSGLEVTLIVMFLLLTIVAVALIVVLATGEPAVITNEDEEVVDFVPECSNIIKEERVDCFPESGASLDKCLKRGCCWVPLVDNNAPWCFFSTNTGYQVTTEERPSNYKINATLERLSSPTVFGADIQVLSFQAEMQTRNRFRFKITDAHKPRFEVPHEHVKPPSGPPNGILNYEFELVKKPFGVKLRRPGSNKTLFDTTMGPLVFADQYLQLSSRLPSPNIYGLGEHVHQNLRHDTNWKTWPIFTRDAFPNGGTHNLYGHYPFFLCLEDASGKSFGVFLMNSNAMEVTLQPSPAVTYRTIGGVLDFYILLGNSPEDVVQEFSELVGRPVIPPYWSLGFQLSRWGYGSLDEVKMTVQRNRAIGLPYEIQYTDIDYMEDKKDFTYDLVKFKDLPQFADYMHAAGQKYILILDPAIALSKRINGSYASYDRGSQMKAWVMEADGETPLEGEVWPGLTVFPDYTNPDCVKWWIDEIQKFYQEVKFDALWIDMNEVSSFQKGSVNGCSVNNLNYPPYTPRILDDLLYSKTLCMDAKHKWGNHYDVHSLYGYSMVLASEQAMKHVFGTNRTLLLTRSSFPGTGKYSGHWLGDNAATWNDLKWAIPGMLEFNLFGIPYIGADICGFFDDTTEELCRRWMQVGAFYPFSRNHNAENYKLQDPASFGADSLLVNTSKHYLIIRYTLLPYLYTLFYRAHINGNTVMRPVMNEFYTDVNTWNVDRQFLWGSALLITPVLDPGMSSVSAYIPDAVWYDYETMERYPKRKQFVHMELPQDKLGLHIRGGHILPTQRPAVTTVQSRRNPLGLIVALDDDGQALGELFWDDGESRDTFESGVYTHSHFSVVNGVLRMAVMRAGYHDPNNLKFENITVLGVMTPPGFVEVTHEGVTTTVPPGNVNYDAVKNVLHIKGLTLELEQNYTVSWNNVFPLTERFDCFPEENCNEADCKARGCIWEVVDSLGVPWCFYPMDHGYTLLSMTSNDTGLTLNIQRDLKFRSQRPESPDINNLRVEINYLSGQMLRFKIYDPMNKRYEVPVPLNIPTTPETDASKRMYDVSVGERPFGIKVTRNSTGTVIWDSMVPGFTFSDLFIQISTRLPSKYIYGFGETEHTSYLHDLNYHTWGMFSKDQPPGYKLNSYGVHPFYMGLESTSDAHGVLLLNSNAMDVTLQPTPALTYRTIGGILDFFMVMGPTPEMVVQEYTALIGRPVLPAYWSLGFQLCRYGYENDTEIENLYNDMRKAGIPYDVQYADIDYMERQLDFTLNPDFKGLPALVNHMREEGMRFIFILDPAISGNETNYPSFTNGVEQDVFIKWPESNEIMWGKVWPDLPGVTVNESLDWESQVEKYRAYTAFPDFFRSQTANWWQAEIANYYQHTMKFDGLWIDMNEPASFVHGTVGGKCPGPDMYNNPPYIPPLESKHMGLNHKTLCMTSLQFLPDGTPVKQYDVHSLYGWSQAKPTYDALQNVTNQRGVVVSRSTYPSSGKWVGHWLGDNNASWDQLFKSVIGMLEFSLFGISYTGADICGFFNTAEYEMCLRWMQLGAFYPYSRNHNGKGNPRQDPVAWNSTFASASRDVLNIRYTLLPYLYTLMFQAHSEGSTVIRPLLHEFVTDKATWNIDRQFLWGPALLISPAMDPGVTEVSGYIPDARWYDYHTAMDIKVRRQQLIMSTPLNHINLHVRGGYILPWQKPENTTRYSRTNPLGLIVALNDTGCAEGSFFWDDGQSIDTFENGKYLLTTFSTSQKMLQNNVLHANLSPEDRLHLGQVEVWGAGTDPVTGVTVWHNADQLEDLPSTSFNHDPQTERLIINVTEKILYVDRPLSIAWKTSI